MTKKRKNKKSSDKCKKRKSFTKDEVHFIIKMHSLKLIYLDNALLGFKSDEGSKIKCGERFLKWVKKNDKRTIISFINIYELRPLFTGRIKKIHPKLSQNVLSTLEEFRPDVISEKDTLKLAKKNKSLWYYLIQELKIGEQDAAHFVVAVACGSDLFVSFNKRAFYQNQRKIRNKLTQLNIQMPDVWTVEEIEKHMDLYDCIMSK